MRVIKIDPITAGFTLAVLHDWLLHALDSPAFDAMVARETDPRRVASAVLGLYLSAERRCRKELGLPEHEPEPEPAACLH